MEKKTRFRACIDKPDYDIVFGLTLVHFDKETTINMHLFKWVIVIGKMYEDTDFPNMPQY